jgi:hypothetical protein
MNVFCNSQATLTRKDGNKCTDDICSNKLCSHPNKANGASCADDGKPCTDGTCKSGSCG